VKLEAEEVFNPTDEGCELMIENYTDEELGNPNDSGPMAG
jgi:hypothetical protein